MTAYNLPNLTSPTGERRYRNFTVANASKANIAESNQNRVTTCVSSQPFR